MYFCLNMLQYVLKALFFLRTFSNAEKNNCLAFMHAKGFIYFVLTHVCFRACYCQGRAVALALILFICGLVSASVGGVYWLGKSEKPAAPFFILGALTLIPGGYYTYISWQAYRGVDGFSFSQLPEF